MAMFPNILFSRLTFMNFYKKSQINAVDMALNKFLMFALRHHK